MNPSGMRMIIRGICMGREWLGPLLFVLVVGSVIGGIGYTFYWESQQSTPTIQEQYDFIEGTIIEITHSIDWHQDNTYIQFEDGSKYVFQGIVQGLKVGGTYRIYYSQPYDLFHVKLIEEL